jgi:hypothetical protein
MKKLLSIISVVFLLFTCNTAFAQYGGYGGGYGGYGGGYGGRMSQMGGMGGGMNQQQEKPKEIPVEVTVGKIMEQLKPELQLDALQEIAIANILTASIKSQGAIIKQEISQDDKVKETY